MLDQEISNLLAYGQNSLYLDELDCGQAARRICRLLGIAELTPVAPTDDAETAANPNKLVAPLLAYAKERGIAKGDELARLRAEILDAIMLKPSEINDLFAGTYSANKQKALDFLYEYSIKSGYVDLDECAKNDRWEAKELKSKLELIINVMPQTKPDKYPKCGLCHENEGYLERANMRSVACDIGGEEWYFNYVRHQYFDKHGVLCNAEHSPMKGGPDTMVKLAHAADFVGNDGFVCCDSATESGGAHNLAHEHFKTGYRSTPMLRRDVKTKLKSKEYPYLEMGIVDWYSTVIRFSHSSLEKTAEFANKLISAWQGYSDERVQNDGTKNFASVVCRKQGGKYVFDIVLRSSAIKRPRMASDYDEIKPDALSVTDILGYFVLPDKLSEELGNAQLYLDGSLPFEAGTTKIPLAKTVEKLLKAQGGPVSKLEAKLNIHDEIDAVCEKILTSTAVFDDNEITEFLDAMDIEIKR